MSDSKIQIKIGTLEFSGEGAPEWVSAQLDKILEKIPELLKIEHLHHQPHKGHPSSDGLKPENGQASNKLGNFSKFLQEKNATSNQNKKFLATAAYLQLSGKSRLSTSDVTQALRQYNQIKLSNASLNMGQNVSQGFCEKDGKDFFVTDEGFKELGISNNM